ncbi:MAG: hypothetical protein OXI95_14345 [bacterium]|nr:hypothetical protein [bacterium]MDE0418097.1 hypothetical protein [bacterium]
MRAGDELHLAIAGNRQAEAVYSLDNAMIAAGKTLGVSTSPGILLPGFDS